MEKQAIAVKERGILFKGEMVRAILSGQKTQTRRAVKVQPNGPLHDVKMGYWCERPNDLKAPYTRCPYGQVGNRLWVRETWSENPLYDHYDPQSWPYMYRALHGEEVPKGHKWKPSLFMPRSACRILLEITDIRVERLLDISEEDAVAEGIEQVDTMQGGQPIWKNYGGKGLGTYQSAANSYYSLWDKINGFDAYLDNPYVWVITFKQVQP